MVYVNRMLVFLFATDESFKALMENEAGKEKTAFPMACGNLNCINLAHIDVPDTGEGEGAD